MKTYKASQCAWRIEVMNTLGLEYTIKNDMIVYKGNLSKALVGFLVEQRIKLGIKG